jgi:acylphosphatase
LRPAAKLKVRARLLISGLVQGVFFRREISDHARRHEITGWVRNLKDGRVETVLEGEKSRVDDLIRYCHRGPPGARVSNVSIEWLDYTGEFRGFRITK